MKLIRLQTIQPVSLSSETFLITIIFFCLDKPTTSVDVHTSNNKPSLNTNDQTKVKVRLKTIPPSSQTNKNTKPVSNTKTTKSVEQKPLKK